MVILLIIQFKHNQKYKMKNNVSLFSVLLIVAMIHTSCKDAGPNPSEMTGQYTVTAALKEGALNKKAIKDSIITAMESAKEEIAKARLELSEELNLSDIDTSTSEGKIEYATKQFAKTMGETGLNMGDIGKDIGGFFGDLATGGLGLAESLLEKISLDVELQADGDIKTQESFIAFGLKDAKWEVNGDHFLLHHDQGESTDTLVIVNRDSNGFTLEKDKVLITFLKKTD